MPPGERALFKLVSTLYEATADPILWDSFLQQLAHHCGADSGAVVMHSAEPNNRSHTVLNSWNLDPEGEHLYHEHYGPLDIWAIRARLRTSWSVLTSDSLCRQDEFRKSEIYNDMMSRYGIEHGLFGIVENSQSHLATVSLYRSASKEEFQTSDIEVIELLSPHIRRAFKLHFQFSELKAGAMALSTALDIMATGIVLLGAKGEILFMNRAAQAIVTQNEGLIVTRQGLHAERRSESVQLEKLISEASNTSQDQGIKAGGALLVSRKKGSPLQILITPTKNPPIDGTKAPCVIAFISDPEQRTQSAGQTLRTLFRLTPAESRVAMLLGDGHSPREIAQLLAISSNTVKSQISSIYAKTGTSRQAQLVRLLLKLPAVSSM